MHARALFPSLPLFLSQRHKCQLLVLERAVNALMKAPLLSKVREQTLTARMNEHLREYFLLSLVKHPRLLGQISSPPPPLAALNT